MLQTRVIMSTETFDFERRINKTLLELGSDLKGLSFHIAHAQGAEPVLMAVLSYEVVSVKEVK